MFSSVFMCLCLHLKQHFSLIATIRWFWKFEVFSSVRFYVHFSFVRLFPYDLLVMVVFRMWYENASRMGNGYSVFITTSARSMATHAAVALWTVAGSFTTYDLDIVKLSCIELNAAKEPAK